MPSLPRTLGYFVRSAGARPFSQSTISSVTESLSFPPAEKDFGLGALFRTELDILEVIVGPRSGGLDFSQIASGTIGIYRIQPGFQTDVLTRQLDFTQADRRKDKSFRFHMTSPGAPEEELWVACSLLLTTGETLFKSIDAENDFLGNPNLTQRQRTGNLAKTQDVNWHHPAPAAVEVRALDDLAEMPAVKLDFMSAPQVQYADGSLMYSGGGNRFLCGYDGSTVFQKEDEAPWDLDAETFIEPNGRNLLANAGLNSDYGSWHATNDPVVVETRDVFSTFGDSYRLLYYNVSSPKGINSSWFWASPSAACTGETVTGSVFLYAASDDYERLQFELAIQILTPTGTVLHENTKVISYSDLQDFATHEVTWYKPQGATAVQGFARICVRVIDFNPGDRFIIGIGFPQLEYNRTASSRMPSGGTRLRDQIAWVPSSNYPAEMTYGGCFVTWAPLYEGTPDPLGDQILFDTRDDSGNNGLMLMHKQDGVFKARLVDGSGTFAEIESASTIPLIAGQEYTTAVYWDCTSRKLRIDIDGSPLMSRTYSVFPNLGKVPLGAVRFGMSYLETESAQFKLVAFEHRTAPV